MRFPTLIASSAVALAIGLAGCANDGSLALSTGSIANDDAKLTKAQRVDPQCVALMARIDELRKEGTPGRLAKVAEGKSKTASVKREALARMSELDNANSQFQQKCSTLASPSSTPAAPANSAGKTAASAETNAAIQKAQSDVAKTATSAKQAAADAKTAAADTKAAVENSQASTNKNAEAKVAATAQAVAQ